MRAAPSPAVAGFRPLAMALAVAGAFAGAAQAQPTGAQAIHGTATLQQQGNTLVVTTRNGAGSSHSAINWQSFSVPGGTTTRFDQPSASSTSINRVLGNNPSQIFGTLSSNGKLVLVNPAGIAVGAGAVVDTAAFTASTLRMSDADALAGRLVFGDGTGGGLLSVAGQVIARQGDVVLIAPDVRVGEQALVQAPDGATLLAAGQKVALTGRGLEGIQLELRAPEDQALNLGTLQGDAVGIFASQLKHSGAIQATSVSVEGGKVVLKAAESVDIAGTVAATRGSLGGQVHATAGKVRLRSGAVIDVSGRDGGGEALIGGGWQGQDGRITNAQETTVESGATVRADAIEQGNGGTIVAWSDGATRAYGSFSARGGATGGDGGKVETSGHYLDMQGQVDTRAPNGRTGELLLDPTNMWIANSLTSAQAAGMAGSDTTSSGPSFATINAVSDSLVTVSSLQSYLTTTNVVVKTSNSLGTGAGNITVVDPISWATTSELGLWADQNIGINAAITGGIGALVLRADGGSITQAAPITVSSLVAYAQGGSVTLTNAGNSVSSLAGYAGTSGGFSFKSAGSVVIDDPAITSANGLGSFNGIRSLGPVNIETGGSLTINDKDYGIDAFSNAVTLTAGGAISEGFGAKLTAGSLSATAFGSISLSGSNSVASFSAAQMDSVSSSESIYLNNSSPSGTLTLGTISNASQFGYVDITEKTGKIVINGDITSQSGLGLRADAAGSSITRTAGTLNGLYVSLFAGSGGIGTAAAPILTASKVDASTTPPTTLLTSITFGAGSFGSGPGSVYISHAGDAQIAGTLAPDAPLAFSASEDLTICCSTISSGTAAMTLTAGDKLLLGTDAFATLSGGSVKLVAQEIESVSGVSISAATLIEVQPIDSRPVKLGLPHVDDNGVLELDFGLINFSVPTGVLRIGSTTSGPLDIVSSIAPSAGTLSLLSGGSITQGAGATITVPKLALKSLGYVNLDQPNNVGELAASLGDASNLNRDLRFHNGPSLTIGTGIDGLSGIGINNISGTYSAGAPDGVISLAAGGTLTQAAGALLAGKAVYAEGSSVVLNEANPTGVIAGKATGGSTATFQYASSNGISLDTVDFFSGVDNSPGLASNAIQLKGTNVSQQPGAAVTTAGGLQLTATAGDVMLLDGANNVGQLSASAAGSIVYNDGANLTVGMVDAGGSINVSSVGAMQVSGPVSTTNGDIALGMQSTSAADVLTVDGTVDAGAGLVAISASAASGGLAFGSLADVAGGTVRLQADDIAMAAGSSIAASSLIEVGPQTLGRPIELGSALFAGTHLQLGAAELASFSTPLLRVGSPSAGLITVGGAIAPTGAGVLSLQTGDNILQAGGATITAPKLALVADNVTLNETNMVGEVAASLTGTNGSFVFKSGQSLNVGLGLDGLSGIMLSGDMSGFDPTAPNTVIALTSSGSLTQSAGALLAGKAVYAEGASVVLTETNPTGVIAGKATGGATGVFHYTSSNGIGVSTVQGVSGVQNAAGTGADAIVLKGTFVSQGFGTSISSAGGLQATATTGGVFLTEANTVASFAATSVGDIVFDNNADVNLAGLSSSTGVIDVAVSGAITISQPMSAPTAIILTGTAVSQSASAPIVTPGLDVEATSGAIMLQAPGNDVSFFTALAPGDIAFSNATDLALGSLSSGSGAITVNADGPLSVMETVSAAGGVKLSAGSISQDVGASIFAGSLQVAASAGSVNLSDSGNNVGMFSASAVGDITFYNTGSLLLDGLSSTTGLIKVGSGGTLTLGQGVSSATGVKLGGAAGISQAVGASIVSGGGLEVFASAGSVLLQDGGNDVLAFAGSASGDIKFADASSLTLAGLSAGGWLKVASGGALLASQPVTATSGVMLAAQSVDQTSGASIVTGGPLQVSASAGAILLGDSNNSVGGFAANASGDTQFSNASDLTLGSLLSQMAFFACPPPNASGDIQFYNAGDLTLGSLSSAGGLVGVGTGGALTVPQAITAANGIMLGAGGSLGENLSVGASLDAGSGGVTLGSASGSVLFGGTAGVAGSGDAFFSAPAGAVRVAAGTTTLSSHVASSEFITVDGGTLVAGTAITVPNLLLASGALQGADLTIGSHLDWTGGTMAGTGKTIISSSATADIYGPVTAARKVVNDGSIALWGSGNIAVASGFELVNNGLFEIQGDGGFSGGVGSIQNSGTFRKGSTATPTTTPAATSPLAFAFTTGVSAVDVASFSNTGTLEVNEGTLQFAPLAFGTNAGLIWLESGTTLDNSNTTLSNTGWVKGSGTLALGTGALDNSGGLAPGGLGGIGNLAIQAATVNLQSGSTLLVDVADALNYDTLQVSGDVALSSGASISPNTGSATLAPGASFDFIASTAGTVSGTLPTVSGFDVAFVASPASLRLSVPLPPPPPAPAPSGSPLVDRILEIVPEASPSLVSAMLSEQDNALTTFVTLLVEEEESQAKDAVVNEVSGAQVCKP